MEHKEENVHLDLMKSYCIRVRRRRLWEDGCEELRRGFDIKRNLRVKFIGEKGADGPRREIFSEGLMQWASRICFLKGPRIVVLQHIISWRSEEKITTLLIVLSILSGGPAPKFISKPVVEYLFYGNVIGTRANVTLIADKEYRQRC